MLGAVLVTAPIALAPRTASEGALRTGNTRTFGDVDGDGASNVLDALLIARAATGLMPEIPPLVITAGDVNADTATNILDALVTVRAAVGLPVSGRVGAPVPATTHLTASPSTLDLEPGDSARVLAQIFDGEGNPVSVASVTYQSSSPTVAAVSPTGLVKAMTAGETVISVRLGNTVARVPAVVRTAGGITSLTIPSGGLNLVEGATMRVPLMALDQAGGEVAVPQAAWSSSNAAVVSVDSAAWIRAVTPGTATIRASWGGMSATVDVTVESNTQVSSSGIRTQIIRTIPVTPTALTILPGERKLLTIPSQYALATWSTTSPAIDLSDGGGVAGTQKFLTADLPGPSVTQNVRVNLVFTSSSGVSHVTILPLPVTTISVSKTLVQLGQGQVDFVSAKPLNMTRELPGRTIMWSSSDPAIAAVQQLSFGTEGRIIAYRPGRVELTLRSEGATQRIGVTVTAASQAAGLLTFQECTRVRQFRDVTLNSVWSSRVFVTDQYYAQLFRLEKAAADLKTVERALAADMQANAARGAQVVNEAAKVTNDILAMFAKANPVAGTLIPLGQKLASDFVTGKSDTKVAEEILGAYAGFLAEKGGYTFFGAAVTAANLVNLYTEFSKRLATPSEGTRLWLAHRESYWRVRDDLALRAGRLRAQLSQGASDQAVKAAVADGLGQVLTQRCWIY